MGARASGAARGTERRRRGTERDGRRRRGGGDGDGGGARGRPRTSRRAGHRARRARARREPPRDQPGGARRPSGVGGGRGGRGGREDGPSDAGASSGARASLFGGHAADDSARGGRAHGGSGGRRRRPWSIRRLAGAGRERTPRRATSPPRADHDVARLRSSRFGARRSARGFPILDAGEAGPTRRDSAHLLRRAGERRRLLRRAAVLRSASRRFAAARRSESCRAGTRSTAPAWTNGCFARAGSVRRDARRCRERRAGSTSPTPPSLETSGGKRVRTARPWEAPLQPQFSHVAACWRCRTRPNLFFLPRPKDSSPGRFARARRVASSANARVIRKA